MRNNGRPLLRNLIQPDEGVVLGRVLEVLEVHHLDAEVDQEIRVLDDAGDLGDAALGGQVGDADGADARRPQALLKLLGRDGAGLDERQVGRGEEAARELLG